MAGRFERFTVDNLAETSGPVDSGLRREVLDGRLLVSPPQPRRHDRVVGNLASRFWHALPAGVAVRGGLAIRLPDGDGPVPDLLVAGAWPPQLRVLPATAVPTVVEVVSTDGHYLDRVWKQQRYAEAGIPCYWRVELEPWSGYRGPLPVVMVRLRGPAGWQELIAPAGQLHTLPVAHRRRADGVVESVPVRFDPGVLTIRQAMTR